MAFLKLQPTTQDTHSFEVSAPLFAKDSPTTSVETADRFFGAGAGRPAATAADPPQNKKSGLACDLVGPTKRSKIVERQSDLSLISDRRKVMI